MIVRLIKNRVLLTDEKYETMLRGITVYLHRYAEQRKKEHTVDQELVFLRFVDICVIDAGILRSTSDNPNPNDRYHLSRFERVVGLVLPDWLNGRAFLIRTEITVWLDPTFSSIKMSVNAGNTWFERRMLCSCGEGGVKRCVMLYHDGSRAG
jgi:hypothetical protein